MTEPAVAIVTGAARGLGLAIATKFRTDGLTVVGVDRSRRTYDSMDQIDAIGIVADLSDDAAITALPQQVEDAVGGTDIVVNCAGLAAQAVGGEAGSEAMSLDVWNQVVAVNLTAPFRLSVAMLPLLRRSSRARIVNISSRAGRTAIRAGDPAYAASKTGLIGLTRHMAAELAGEGIAVNAVAPGFLATDGADRLDAALYQRIVSEIPVGTIGTPQQVAELVAFLSAEHAGYITGAVFDINGGAFIG